MSGRDEGPFSPRLVLALIVAAVVAMGGFALLTTYAPDLSAGRDGGPHALSQSAVGFAGLVRLVEARGDSVDRIRDPDGWSGEPLLLVPLVPGQDQARLADLVESRKALPTLLILPKWAVGPKPARPGWVEERGLLPPDGIAALGRGVPLLQGLDILQAYEVREDEVPEDGYPGARQPRPRLVPVDAPPGLATAPPFRVQTAAVPDALTLVATADQRAVLLQLGEGPLYLLADPDLLANHALDDPAVARAALLLLDELNTTGANGIAFDLFVAGLAGERNLFRLAFEPPFVALTLALLGAALLAAMQAAVRFGRPSPEARAIPFGVRALVENSAGLLRRAGRDHRVGSAYAGLVRDRAAAAIAAPADLGGPALDAYLDRLSRTGAPRFTDLSEALAAAGSREELLAAAVQADHWLQELTHQAGTARRSREPG